MECIKIAFSALSSISQYVCVQRLHLLSLSLSLSLSLVSLHVLSGDHDFILYIYVDLEWKVLYVGSANDAAKDQVLDEILVGPVPVGVNKFVLQADAPLPSQLPPDEILGVTVVLVTCSYKEREFVRVGYYVNNEYLRTPEEVAAATTAAAAAAAANADPQQQPTASAEQDPQQQPPVPPPTAASLEAFLKPPPPYPQLDMNRVQRQILADKPRVTKFPIQWGASDTIADTTLAAASAENSNIMMEQDVSMDQEHDFTKDSKMAATSGTPSTTGTDMEME
jgi:histone chaperone ASF1